MHWGLQNRLSRIIQPSTGRCVMLAVDHGYFLGPTRRLERPRETISPLLPYADCLMVTRGVLRTSIDPTSDTAIMLRVSGGPSVVGAALSDEQITTGFEDALRLNAAGVTCSVFVGTPHERQTVAGLASLVDEGERYGVPVMGVTAVGKELEQREARFLALCSRMCAEMGAHLVKTYFCADFHKVVDSCMAPIVIAGGPKLETERDVFDMVQAAVEAGAVGCDMGRNIWQHDHPIPMITTIRKIVHENYDGKEALQFFEAQKAAEGGGRGDPGASTTRTGAAPAAARRTSAPRVKSHGSSRPHAAPPRRRRRG